MQGTDKSVLNKLSYGLFILTSEENTGCVINTVMQVTDEPLCVIISVNKKSATHDALQKSKKFNISVLSESARFELIKRFGFQSSRDTDKFSDFTCKDIAENGIYYITSGTNSYLSANVKSVIDCGTHSLFFAEVTDAKQLSSEPSATYEYYHKHIKPAPEVGNSAGKGGKWVCKICNYIYEGDVLPDGYVCPICNHPASDFEYVGK